MQATLAAARAAFKRRIVAVFQPHRYTRLRDLFDGFLDAFDDADVLYLMDIYPAGEEAIAEVYVASAVRGVVPRGHLNVRYLGDEPDAAAQGGERIGAGDLIVTLGAGDIYELGEALLAMTRRTERKPMSRLEDELRARFGERLKVNQSLAEFTSFRIGGPADLFVDGRERSRVDRPRWRWRIACACALLSGCWHQSVGQRSRHSRTGDEARRGLRYKIAIDGVQVPAGPAAHFGALVETVVERGLAGLEFGEGIPGTVGGGLVMNAGAFGGEMARVVTCVHGVTARARRAR